MAIPAVQPFSQQPGGGIVTAMRGINALTESNLDNQIKRIEAQYKPLTLKAQAMSQMTYANLMGPQFMAKMLGNPDIASNLSEDQLKKALDMTYGAGTGQGQRNSVIGNIFNPPPIQDPLIELAKKGFQILSGKSTPPMVQQNPQMTQSPQMPANNSTSQGSGYLMRDDGSFPSVSPLENPNPNMGFDKNGQPYYKGPTNAETYFERAGRQQGIKEAGKEAGKIRSQDVQELNTTAFNANTMQGTLDGLSEIVNSPEFQQIRQIPIAGQHEIGWYAQYGTPAQKRMIGKFLSEQGQVVINAASQFKGAFRAGEQALINTMKVNPSDMPEVASGKIQGMSLMNKMLSERAALTAQLMEDQNMSKGKAMKIADKNIDTKKIKDELDKVVKISIKNKKTGERKIISLSEARKLGVPNV